MRWETWLEWRLPLSAYGSLQELWCDISASIVLKRLGNSPAVEVFEDMLVAFVPCAVVVLAAGWIVELVVVFWPCCCCWAEMDSACDQTNKVNAIAKHGRRMM
jgi:hypothetical protein